jgi:hypothetical protein
MSLFVDGSNILFELCQEAFDAGMSMAAAAGNGNINTVPAPCA